MAILVVNIAVIHNIWKVSFLFYALFRNTFFTSQLTLNAVSMVLNPRGIEPTFEKKCVFAGGGFYSYYDPQHIKLDKERKNVQKKF